MSYLTDTPEDIQSDWFEEASVVGVTAGASAPEELVNNILARMCSLGAESVEELAGIDENMFFEVPKELQ